MESLSPKLLNQEDLRDKDAYKAVECLRNALLDARRGNIRNIALTGPYGSGKSTVLKTLQRDLTEGFSYLSLSLATLHSDDTSENFCSYHTEIENEAESFEKEYNTQKKAELNRKIEYSILQQLIYREKASKVPSSRFKRITHYSKSKLCLLTLACIVFIVSIFIAFEPTFARIETFYELFNFGEYNLYFDVLAAVYMLGFMFFLIRNFIQGYSNSKLNKLNLKDGEIDIKEDNSIFNKHLDEILYFFEVTDYNVVIIEDLDRFNSPDIYLKLRELNLLINESKDIQRHVVFIYAVKDDVFVDEARTKFFDYICPVIPIINPSNSKDILKEKLEASGLKKGAICDNDLAAMAFFIQDMRILNNIVNEFEQYRSRLVKGDNALNLTKLLAMIVYKNYFPQDFAKLHRRKGLVYNCISLKKEFIKTALGECEKDRKIIEEEYKKYKTSNALSISEIRKLFISDLIAKMQFKPISIKIGNHYRSFDEICSNNDYFKELLSLKDIEYNEYYYYGQTRTTHQAIDVRAEYNSANYSERTELISGKTEKWFKEALNKIDVKERRIKSLPLHELLSMYKDIRNSDTYKDIRLEELMETFLLEGYIDEDYYDYISYFYPGMISPSDRNYLIGIRRLQDPIFELHIDKIDNFILELQPRNFRNDSILNLELFDYFVNHRNTPKLSEYYKQMVDLLNCNSRRLEFFALYYENGVHSIQFFKSYLKQNIDTIWSEVVGEANFQYKDCLIECMLRFAPSINNEMAAWCSKNYKYIRNHQGNIEGKIIEDIIRESDFEELDDLDPKMLNKIINGCRYVINDNNLLIVLRELHKPEAFKNASISFDSILSCGDQNTIDYLLSKDYIDATYQCIDKAYEQESITAINFIVKSALSEEAKREYLCHQKNKRGDIDGLDENNIQLLVECNLIAPTWTNVNALISMFNVTNFLSEFVCKNYEHLSKDENNIEWENDNEIKLFENLFGNNEILPIMAYKSLLPSFKAECDGDDFLKHINNDRFKALLENGSVPFSEENIQSLKGTPNYFDYLCYFHKEVIANKDYSYSINSNVCENLLKSSKISLEDKAKIIRLCDFAIISNSKTLCTLSGKIISQVFGGEFGGSELRVILQNCTDVQSNILLANMILRMNNYDDEEIASILNNIGNDGFTELAERHKKPKLKATESVKRLLDTLIENHFISSITTLDNYYRPNYRIQR